MSVTKSRSRVLAAGAAVLALAALTGCNESDSPTASAPTDSAPASSDAAPSGTPTSQPKAEDTPTEDPTSSDAPTASSESPDAAPTDEGKAPAAGSAGLTKSGTALKFGQPATLAIDKAGTDWIGAVKVVSLKAAPKADYKDMGVRDDQGTVYYLRYDVTYKAGKTKYPPEGGDVSWAKLHPVFAQGQKVQLINNPSFKKCTTLPYGADGHIDSDKQKLGLGDTATNMCLPFLVDKGKLTTVEHEFFDDKTSDQNVVTWK